MIVDLRIYTCRPNRAGEFVAIYKEMAWALQQKYLGRCLGWFTTQEGQLNQVVHLWAYESQADRETRRAALAADPAWGAYLARVAQADVLLAMENRLLRPTDFSPVA